MYNYTGGHKGKKIEPDNTRSAVVWASEMIYTSVKKPNGFDVQIMAQIHFQSIIIAINS